MHGRAHTRIRERLSPVSLCIHRTRQKLETSLNGVGRRPHAFTRSLLTAASQVQHTKRQTKTEVDFVIIVVTPQNLGRIG